MDSELEKFIRAPLEDGKHDVCMAAAKYSHGLKTAKFIMQRIRELADKEPYQVVDELIHSLEKFGMPDK